MKQQGALFTGSQRIISGAPRNAVIIEILKCLQQYMYLNSAYFVVAFYIFPKGRSSLEISPKCFNYDWNKMHG